MCGIVGISLTHPQPCANDILRGMADQIAHRGPDSDGFFVSDDGRGLLGFRRLAIRDLNARANQPMTSACGNYTIAFNGEIYNTTELKEKYCSHITLRTTSDTEILVESFAAHGKEIFSDLNGMFGLAIYDHQQDTTTLTRDRVGKKPLYVYQGEDFIAFGSELRVFQPFGLQMNPAVAPLFFHFGYLPAPHTFFQQVTQIMPAEVVSLKAGQIKSRSRYHQFSDLPWGSEEEIDHQELQHLIDSGVQQRLLSDVPLGAFLSGGIDSSLVIAALPREIRQQFSTFTIAFDDEKYNEAPAAQAIARHLQVKNELIQIQETDLVSLVETYYDCYEEPYADISGLPTIKLCSEVKKHVTVALSGDGGDEFFTGYQRYMNYKKLLLAQKFPYWSRKLLGSLMPLISNRLGKRIQRLLQVPDPASLYANLLKAYTAGSLQELMPEFEQPDLQGCRFMQRLFEQVPNKDPLARAACYDATYYIPDDLQKKVDRASMQVALEVRCPLLDHRIITLGAKLATEVKLQGGLKSVLKKQLSYSVPKALYDRPKQGFSVPLGQWLAGPLRSMADDLLSSKRLTESGWIDPQTVMKLWQDFQNGTQHYSLSLWLIMSTSWHLNRWVGQVPSQYFPQTLRKAA